MSKKPFSPRDAALARSEGTFRRFNWRPRHRIGPGFDQLHGRELRRWLRQVSWRRTH